MIRLLKEKTWEAVTAVAPLIAVVCVLQIFLVGAPAALFVQFLVGALLAGAGMMLLFVGIDLGILPMGRYIGAKLPEKGSLSLIVAVAFLFGFATTVAEPDVLVLASQAAEASDGTIRQQPLIYVIGLGVAVFAAIAMARVVHGFPMRYLLSLAFAAMLGLAFATPGHFVPVAFDAGSVTTGVLTAPVVIALAAGVSAVLSGRSATADGFGLLGFASIGAIIAVMILGILLAGEPG